ncbi:MAG: hypothetical protein J7498_03155 [Sphingobium sp.]|nr:hypothetical protein [Sphingobium sp.]
MSAIVKIRAAAIVASLTTILVAIFAVIRIARPGVEYQESGVIIMRGATVFVPVLKVGVAVEFVEQRDKGFDVGFNIGARDDAPRNG